MFVETSDISVDEMYKLLIGSVLPRPIAWIGSLSKQGIANLAPFSFFNVVSVKPPVLAISILNKTDGEKKDSLSNIIETGCFSVNIVNHALAYQMSVTSGNYAASESEFEIAGLTSKPCSKIQSIYCLESPISYECELREVISFGSEAQAGNLVLGNVVALRADESIIDWPKIDAEKLDPIGRMAGSHYSTVRDKFEIQRPVNSERNQN